MADNNIPRMNRYQVETQRAIAEQQIVAALTNFAQQLPNGMLHLQAAINEAGEILDELLRRTGQYDEAAQFEPGTPPNPDLAAHREAVAGVEESTEIIDYDSGG